MRVGILISGDDWSPHESMLYMESHSPAAPMSGYWTPPASTSPHTKSIDLTRGQVVAIALLACISGPIVSLGSPTGLLAHLVARASTTASFNPETGSVKTEGAAHVHGSATPADAANRSILIRTEASSGLGRGTRIGARDGAEDGSAGRTSKEGEATRGEPVAPGTAPVGESGRDPGGYREDGRP